MVSYVDLGLLTLVRAEATIVDGRLITEGEALAGLRRFAVPPSLVNEIARRRYGDTTELTPWQRVRRAQSARHLVASGIRNLGLTDRDRRGGKV